MYEEIEFGRYVLIENEDAFNAFSNEVGQVYVDDRIELIPYPYIVEYTDYERYKCDEPSGVIIYKCFTPMQFKVNIILKLEVLDKLEESK